MVGLSFYGLSKYDILKWVTTATMFLPKNVKRCCSQVATTLTLISDFSVEQLKLENFQSNATENSIEKIVVPKRKSLNLLTARRVFLLGHCIATTVPISPQSPE